jgi:16S rRNA (uracil1498-N3)-methyltransferase
MNSFVVYREEGWSEGRIVLLGDRARAACTGHLLGPGAELRVALFGGDKGICRVSECSNDRVVLEIIRTEPSLPLRPVDLIVGLSRPQTTKKVIQAAVMSGVRSLHLVHLFSGEKSYLDSHILREDVLNEEVARALEQIWEGHYPEIRVHRSFKSFLNSAACQLLGGTAMKVLAQPGAALFCGDASTMHGGVVLAVGSEGGWSQSELAALTGLGFVPAGLGQRVVRVEVALLYLLGQTLTVGHPSSAR